MLITRITFNLTLIADWLLSQGLMDPRLRLRSLWSMVYGQVIRCTYKCTRRRIADTRIEFYVSKVVHHYVLLSTYLQVTESGA